MYTIRHIRSRFPQGVREFLTSLMRGLPAAQSLAERMREVGSAHRDICMLPERPQGGSPDAGQFSGVLSVPCHHSTEGIHGLMAWDIEYTNEFGDWWVGLAEGEQEDVTAVVELLAESGPGQ